MAKFYFTFGTDPEYPYRGGWVTIEAKNINTAQGVFMALFPNERTWFEGASDVCNCADIYTEERFNRTNMPKRGNYGAFCHAEYHLIKKHRRKRNVCEKETH